MESPVWEFLQPSIPFISSFFPILVILLYLAWKEGADNKRRQALTDRLATLYKCTGAPVRSVRTRNPLAWGRQRPLIDLDKSLRFLERHYQIRVRRPPFSLIQSDDSQSLDHFEQRIEKLEQTVAQ